MVLFFFFSCGLPSCMSGREILVWEKFGSLKWELWQKSNSLVLEVVKDICLWPQTPPAAAALVQAILQGLSQTLALGITQTFCTASALPVLHFVLKWMVYSHNLTLFCTFEVLILCSCRHLDFLLRLKSFFVQNVLTVLLELPRQRCWYFYSKQLKLIHFIKCEDMNIRGVTSAAKISLSS